MTTKWKKERFGNAREFVRYARQIGPVRIIAIPDGDPPHVYAVWDSLFSHYHRTGRLTTKTAKALACRLARRALASALADLGDDGEATP